MVADDHDHLTDGTPASRREETELLTVEEVAALLKLTKKGIYSLVEARRIAHVKVSNRLRFFYADVVAWLRENRVPASER